MNLRHPAVRLAFVAVCAAALAGCGQKASNAAKPAEAAAASTIPVYDAHGKTGMDAGKDFLDREIGDMSSLSRADQEAQLQWFADAAKPYAGMEIKVVSESLTSHDYESKVLGQGLHGAHRHQGHPGLSSIQEGDLVEKLQTQMQSGQNIYDAYVNDSDLIGTHWRYQQVRNLTDFMGRRGQGGHRPAPGRG